MSYPQDVDKFQSLQFATPARRFLPLLVGGVGVAMILIGIGITVWKQQVSESVESNEVETTQNQDFVKGVQSVKVVKVDISGAVLKPGLVEIPADSRVQDVLISAGGFHAKADRSYISRSINLAQPIQDGMKIYIPFENELPTNGQLTSTNQNESFNINAASQAKLEELPGIGPVTAKKIIDNRPYASVEDLLSKNVVGKSVFEKIKTQIVSF